MDVREKLVGLLTDNLPRIGNLPKCDNPLQYTMDEIVERIADHLIAHGVTVQEWIPVSDPPKEKGCYLISVTHWLDGKAVTREANWNGTRWLSCYRREDITPRVTHWMPMPQPPKGE